MSIRHAIVVCAASTCLAGGNIEMREWGEIDGEPVKLITLLSRAQRQE